MNSPGGAKPGSSYQLRWSSSTSPPVTSPFEFVAYGYSSCSGWATMITYLARALGVPARQTGTPCWNSGDFAGLAVDNAHVHQCWHGGNATSTGGHFLYNHNWCEYYDSETKQWVYLNVPPASKAPNEGLCDWSYQTGCNYDKDKGGCASVTSGIGAAMRDHEIFAITWTLPGEEEPGLDDGGAIVDVKNLALSTGEHVSPLVWSPSLSSPLGEPLRNVGLRVVNRTGSYRCHEPSD